MSRDAAFRLGSPPLHLVAGRRVLRACARLTFALTCFATALGAGAPASAATKKPAPKAAAKPQASKPGAKPGAKGSSKSGGKGAKHGHAKGPMLERHVAAFKGGLPNVQALGALVIDENGHELFSRNPDKERPIASVSKLAAVLVVMDRGLELDGLSTIEKTDLEVARGGAHSRLFEGFTVSNRDLLHAALLGSDNRAIPALGRAVKLTPSQLAAAMTAKAKELGLAHTRFHDPTGLSPENVSTPRDTIVMLKAVMKHPVLSGITHRITYDAHPVGRPAIVYTNTYRPAIRPGIEVLAGKTGYNDQARYCLVIATRIAGQTYFMSFLANEGKLTRFGDVARVADWIVQHRAKAPNEVLAAEQNAKSKGPPASKLEDPVGQPELAPSEAAATKVGPPSPAPASPAPSTTTPASGPAPAPVAPSASGPRDGSASTSSAAKTPLAPPAFTPVYNPPPVTVGAPTTPQNKGLTAAGFAAPAAGGLLAPAAVTARCPAHARTIGVEATSPGRPLSAASRPQRAVVSLFSV